MTWRDPSHPSPHQHAAARRALHLAAHRRALPATTVDRTADAHGPPRCQVMAVWDFEAAVERRDATGGTSKRSVLEQAAKLEAWAEPKAEQAAKRQKK